MEFTLENEILTVTVTTSGAQVKSVLRKCDGVEHIWQADPAVWGQHAPILFPYAGRLPEGKMTAKGRLFEGLSAHGFARDMEHALVSHSRDTLILELTDRPETLAKWPYRFRLLSTFRLEGHTLHHTLTVENRDEEPMAYGIGFHPGFALPFDKNHSASDYVLQFDSLESPLCLGTLPHGLLNGKCYYLGKNIREIPLDDRLFANDSHCMVGLSSKYLSLTEKGTGRSVRCKIEKFPYVLIWSMPGEPKFVCMEPWESLPSAEGGSIEWNEKPAAAILTPGESRSTTLSTSFLR